MVPPARIAVTPSVLDKPMLGVSTVSVSLALLLEELLSPIPLGGFAVKVFVTLPLLAVTLAVTVKLMLPPLGKVGTVTVPASRLAMLSWPVPVPAVGQAAPPEAEQAPNEVLFNPETAGSNKLALLASAGPLFVRVNV